MMSLLEPQTDVLAEMTTSSSSHHRVGSGGVGPLFCQLYQTYLPPSYLPPSCQDSAETYPQWAWSLINTVFVSVTTIFNTTIFLAVVFLWMVNRQFHLKKAKHSYDKKPLQLPLKKPVKALNKVKNKAKKSLKNAAKRMKRRRKNKGGVGDDDDNDKKDEEDVLLLTERAKKLAEQKRHKSFQTFLDHCEDEDDETDGDDDEAIEKSLDNATQQTTYTAINDKKSPTSTGPETRAKKKRTRDLLHLASKIEVFSYLSPEAVADILEYVEYVDFEHVGEAVYDNAADTFDGSMYAVVDGEVTTSLSIRDDGTSSSSSSGGVNNDNSNPDFSFVAGPGEVITSMLTIITSLVREYQLQDALLHSILPGVFDGESIGIGSSSSANKFVVPRDMNVRAIVTKPNTRLLRVPARCFVAILKKFPCDVYNITQTIVARLQRVTIQTLVRFLGLDAGLLGMSDSSSTSAGGWGALPQKKPRSTTMEWNEFEQSLPEEEDSTSASSLLDRATIAAASLLGSAEHSRELKEGTSIVNAPPGTIICSKGQPPDAIYLILKGSLDVGLEKNVTQHANSNSASSTEQNGEHKKAKRTKIPSLESSESTVDDQNNSSFKPLFNASPGNWCGLFSCFTHDASFITARVPEINAKKCSSSDGGGGAMLLKIPEKTFQKVVSNNPRALIHCLLDIIDTIGDGANLCISPAMFLLDMGLDWMHVEAGEFISVRGEPCDSMFVVLNGRLRTETSQEDHNHPSKSSQSSSNNNHEEYGRGATFGELEALAEESWANSVYAIRHCEVARIPSRIINILMKLFPASGLHFAKVIASQLHSRKGLSGRGRSMDPHNSLLPSYALSLATIAVVPMTEELDVSEFSSFFVKSLTYIAPTKLLTKKETKERVGDDFFKHRNQMLKVKMTRVLGDVEESNRLVVYESDYKYTWWTKLCIQQADCVLILVDSKTAPERKRVEECLTWANKAKHVRIELVVIQSSSSQEVSSGEEHASDNLNNWSEERPWITKHHLVRCSFANHVQDFHRMSRRVTGQSIGLVMGGGGARGLAHLGIIKALNEAGLAVDMVGGTSQGAFVGALLARNPDDYDQLAESVHEMAKDMSNISNKLRDLTFPLTSFFSGHHFNRGIKKILGDIRIQDLVLNFFCVSVDISNSCQMVHTKGLAWKYVRASMSLTGYLPPISENNRLLVDGGYMNIVPADVMADMGAKKIIAVDVSLEEKTLFYDYGTELSGMWLLWNSWNPFVQTVKVPSMGDINERLSWVSSERTKKDIIKNKVDLFLRPPVGNFGTLEFDKIDEIVKIGYDYAKPLVEKWAEENRY